MANKTANTKHKPVRRALRANEYYNPKTKRYEYHYIDAFGKKRVVSSYILEATDQVPKGKRAGQSLRDIQFSGHIGESRILRVTPPFQKAKEKPVTANVQLTGLLIPSAPSNLPV